MNTSEKNVLKIIINSLQETQGQFQKIVADESKERRVRADAEEYLMFLESELWDLELEYNGKLSPEELERSRGTNLLAAIAHSLYYETRKPLCAILEDKDLPIEKRIMASDKLKIVENVLAAVKTEYEESRSGTTAIPFDEMFYD